MKYVASIRGENFEMLVDDVAENLGFFTTRVVKADCVEEAELRAVENIKNDQDLINGTLRSSKFEPKVYVDEIYKAKWWAKVGGKGFSFFPMEETDDRPENTNQDET